MNETPKTKLTIDDLVEAQHRNEMLLERIVDALEYENNRGHYSRISFWGWSTILTLFATLPILGIKEPRDGLIWSTNMLLLAIAVLILDQKYQLNRSSKAKAIEQKAKDDEFNRELDRKILAKFGIRR